MFGMLPEYQVERIFSERSVFASSGIEWPTPRPACTSLTHSIKPNTSKPSVTSAWSATSRSKAGGSIHLDSSK